MIRPLVFRFWFFQVPTAEEACEEDLEDGGNAKAKTASIEHARVEIERMNFTLEAGTGTVRSVLTVF